MKLDLNGKQFGARMEYRSDRPQPDNWARAEVDIADKRYELWWYIAEPDIDLDEQKIDWMHPDESFELIKTEYFE